MELSEEIRREKIISIVRGVRQELLLPLAEALYAGGIRLLEIAFDPAAPADAPDPAAAGIRLLRGRMEGKMRIGAGTVLDLPHLHAAADAGAEFIISPNVSEAVIRETVRLGLVSIPGAMTPTDAEAAWEAGADFVKIFPAGALGTGYVRALRAPLGHIPMLAVGGIDENNCAAFLNAGCCGVGVGSALANAGCAERGEWDRITQKAVQYGKAVSAHV